MEARLKALVKEIKSPYKYNVNLKNHTSLRIGGPCRILIELENDDDLIKCLSYLQYNEVPCFLLGNGTNLLVGDKGFSGIILKLGKKYNYVDCYKVNNNECLIKAGASKLLSSLVHETAKKSLTGLEWGCGIPGTVGGACMMNAGAHGGEISHILAKIEGFDVDALEKFEIPGDDLRFKYRGLDVGNRNIIITAVWLNLTKGKEPEILRNIEKFNRLRKGKQPKLPNAGSVFKNPPGDFAGRLLEECGMKGYRIGKVSFSEKHANFIVNENNGKAIEAWQLIEEARENVKAKFGIELSLELKVIGNF